MSTADNDSYMIEMSRSVATSDNFSDYEGNNEIALQVETVKNNTKLFDWCTKAMEGANLSCFDVSIRCNSILFYFKFHDVTLSPNHRN